MERLDTRLPFGGMHRTFDAKRRAGVSVEPYAGNTCDEQAHQLALRDGGRFQKEVFDVPARSGRRHAEAFAYLTQRHAVGEQSRDTRSVLVTAIDFWSRIAITHSTDGRTPQRRLASTKSSRHRARRGRTRPRTSNGSSDPRDANVWIASSCSVRPDRSGY